MAITLISSLVALCVVGKLLGDPNPTDLLSFLHKGPKGTQTHTFCSQEVSPPPAPKPELSWNPSKAAIQGEPPKG